MQIRVSALVLLVALSFSFLLLPQGAARADDGESLRQVQAALNKSDFDEAVKLLKPLVGRFAILTWHWTERLLPT